MSVWLTVFVIGLTVSTYALSRWVARRYQSPLTTPVFFSTTIIILVLVLADIEVEEYEFGKQIMVYLLGPATVGLAVPLYRNRATLIRNGVAAATGLVVGSVSTLLVAVLLAKLFQLSGIVLASISIKSVTAPIAIELSPLIAGNPTLTAAFVIATGMIGAMLGPWLMNILGIVDPLARGLALGTISHGQGTAQAVIEGELQGAAASIGMGVAAVLTSLIAPYLVPIFV